MATPAEDLTKCGICKETVKDPKGLPCLHTFCLVCLREWTEHDTTASKSVICPACKKNMPLPDGGVDCLPGNFFVSTLMERSQVLKPMNVACVCCEEMGSKLLARCLTCDGFLCNKGTDLHKTIKLLKSHQVIKLEDLKSGKVDLQTVLSKQPTCNKHKGQPLWFFCETCGVLICRDCTVVNHQKPEHVYVELDCAIKEQKREIQQLVEESDAVTNQVNDALHKARSTRRSLDSNAKQALSDIEKAEEEAIKLIRKLCQDEKDRLDDYVTDVYIQIDAAEERLVTKQAQLKRAQEMATQVLETGSDYDVASVYKQLKTSLQDVCALRPSSLDTGSDNIAYKADNILPMTNQHLGTLTLGTRKISSGDWVLKKEFGQEGHSKMSSPKDVATTPFGDIAVANWDASTPVHVYNTDGKFKFSLSKKSFNASNIAVSSVGKFYVLIHCHKYVTVYSPKGQYLSEFPAVSPEGVKSSGKAFLNGLAINSHNQLLVGEILSKYISIHDLNGSHVTSIKVPVSPCYIASTKQNNIVISAGASHTSVHVIDMTGKLLVAIDGIPGVKGWSSSGVCVSLNNEICIANLADKSIHCFSVDGKYLRCIYNGLKCPRGMVLMEDEKLLVVERGNESVKILTPA